MTKPSLPLPGKKRVSRLAMALEPRMMFDAAMVQTAEAIAADVPASESAPGVQATPVNSTITITDGTTSFPATDLFSKVTVSTETGGSEELSSLVITVDASGANQALVVDGTQIKLVATDLAGSTAGQGYSYQVAVSGGTATITLSLGSSQAGYTAAAVQTLIDGLAYQALDKSVESGEVVVTLKSLSDESDTTELGISARVTIDSQINVAPVLDSDGSMQQRETFTPDDLDWSGSTSVVYTADGKHAYAAGSNGIVVFGVDAGGALSVVQQYASEALGNVRQIVVSTDGRSLYAISSESSFIHATLDADGKVISVEAVSAQYGRTTGGLEVSEDGRYVYVGTEYSDVVIFTRDLETGSLTYLERAVSNGNSRNGVVVAVGDRVYVMYSLAGASAHTLTLYQRNADGLLSELGSVVAPLGASNSGAIDYALAASADGNYLYAANPISGAIGVFQFVDGSLVLLETTSLAGVSSMALSQDGTQLYVATTAGTVSVYAVNASGGLALSGEFHGTSGIQDIVLAADGSLLAAGGSLVRYSSVQSLNAGEAVRFAEGLNLRDSNNDAKEAGSGNYLGSSLSVTASVAGGTYGLAGTDGLAWTGDSITLDGVTIATASLSGNTLTVTFTASVSSAQANQVLQQLTYTSSAGLAAGSSVTLTLQGSDGVLESNAVVLALLANDAPRANTGEPGTLESATSETAYEYVLPAALFTDAGNDKLAWEVDGLPEGLNFNAATRTISGTTLLTGSFTLTVKVTDSYGASATRTMDLVVEQIANRAPQADAAVSDTLAAVVVGSTGYSVALDAGLFNDPDAIYEDSTLTWSVGELPPGLVFDVAKRTLSGTPSQQGDYAITVTVSDEHGVTAERVLTLRVISQAEADNQAPTLSVDGSELIYGSDGRINGYGDYVYSVEVSEDGRTVIVLGNTSGGWQLAPTGNSTLSVFQRDLATGELTLVQQFVQGSDDGDASNGIEIDGLDSAASATYSADGKYLYLVGKQAASGNYAVTVFAVGADGALSASGQTLELGSTQVKQVFAAADGHLYAVAGNTLYSAMMGVDGTLGSLQTYADQAFGGTAGAVTADAQGRVYVVGSSSLAVYGRNEAGELSLLAGLSSGVAVGNFARSIAVSGEYIYLSGGTNGILTYHYDADTQQLSQINKQGSQLWGMTLSEDGKTLYAGNNIGQLNIYAIGDDGIPTLVKSVAHQGASGNYRALRFAISPDGSSMYVGGFYNSGGLAHISIENGTEVAYAEGANLALAASVALADTEYDALADGAGNYNGAMLTLQREDGASEADRYSFEAGNGLVLEGTEIRLDGQKIAEFVAENGVLSIRFTADATTAVANAVLHQIVYANGSRDPGATIALVLQVQDQYASGVSSFLLRLNVSQVNDAPEVSAVPVASGSHDAGSAATRLFEDALVSAVESGQAITRLVFTVSGVKDGSSEVLRINGTNIPLVNGSGTTVAGYAWTVAVDAETGEATVTLSSSAGINSAEAAALINALAYANLDTAQGTAGERTVTLALVQDNGGTDNGGSDSVQPGLQASVAVSVGQSPSLQAGIGDLGLVDKYASDSWPSPYENIQGVVNAGSWVYVVRAGDAQAGVLEIYARGDDGSLSLTQSIAATEQNGLLGAWRMGMLADGATLYVIGNNGVALFGLDAATGGLTAEGLLGDGLAQASHVLAGESALYVTTGDKLRVFVREGDAWVEGVAVSATDEYAQLTALQLSADGQFLYVGTMGGATQVTVFRVGDDGSLSHVADFAGGADEHYVNHLALSADGKTLYVADNTSLYTLSVAEDGTLARLGDAITLDSQPKQLLLSADDSALIVVGESTIQLYVRAADGSLGEAGSFDGFGDIEDWDNYASLNEIRSATLSADGTQLYLSGEFRFREGFLVLALKPASSTFVEDGGAASVIPGGKLSDPQLDALDGGAGDYQGASIVVERNGGVVVGDRFDFIAGDGLELNANGDRILLNGVEIASFAVDAQTGRLTVTFIASVKQADAQNVLRRIGYASDSDDPTSESSTATFTLTLNDGDGFSDSLTAELNLEGVNDAPTVAVQPVGGEFHAEGEALPLFDGAVVDTIEAGQNIWQVIITLDAAVGSGDILGVDGGKIILDETTSGVMTNAAGVQYQVLREETGTKVIIFLNSTPERAQQVIEGLTYSNSGDALSGTRVISLAVSDGTGEKSVGHAAGQATITLLPVVAKNTPPVLGGGSGSTPYTEQADPVRLAPGASIADAQMDAFAGGKGNYDGAVLTIALGDGYAGSEFGFVAENGLALIDGVLLKNGVAIGAVEVVDGVLTVRFSDGAGTVPTSADVQNTLRQITYANSSDVPSDSIEVRVTLADQRGLVSDALVFAIDIQAVNDAPEVGDDPVLSLRDLETLQDLALSETGLSTPTASAVSADGRYVYIADAEGRVALFSRDTATDALSYVQTFQAAEGVTGLQQLILASDGSSLYALSSDGNAIVRFSVDTAGVLTFQQILRSDYAVDDGNLFGMREIALSADGRNLYLINSYGVAYFSRDVTTGVLSYVGALSTSMTEAPFLWAPTDLAIQDDLVYVVTNAYNGSTLIVYQRGADGGLNVLGYVRAAGSDSLSGVQHVSVSADGARIVVASDTRVDVFTLDTGSGQLTHAYTVNGLEGISDVALAANARALYIALTDGTVQYLAAADGTEIGVYSGVAGVGNLVLADNGVLLALTGDAVRVLKETAAQPATVVTGGSPVLLFPVQQLADAELDGKAAGGNYGGASLLVTGDAGGSFGFQDGNGLVLENGRIVRDGVTLATLDTSVPGALTVTFADGTGTADANAILRQLTYAWSGTAQSGNTQVTVRFNDGDGGASTLTVDLLIHAVPQPGQTDYTLPVLVAGRDAGSIILPETLFVYEGGQDVVWSVGNLPAGMSFDAATRTLSGTPAQTGTVTLAVTVTDSLGATASVELVLTVRENTAPVAVPGIEVTLPVVQLGQNLDYTVPEGAFTDADDDALVLAVSGLPAGLAFDPATGKITGAATVAGHYQLVITATDPNGVSVSRTVELNIAAIAPSVDAQASNPVHTAGGQPVPVFGEVSIDLNGASETVTEVVLVLEGMADDGQDVLILDGVTITLRAGESGTTQGGHAYKVVQDGERLILTLTAAPAGLEAATAEALLEGMRYANTSDVPGVSSTRSIALTTLNDSGDTAGGGANGVTVDLRSVITVEAAEPETPVTPVDPVPQPEEENSWGTPLSALQPDTVWFESGLQSGLGQAADFHHGDSDLLRRLQGSLSDSSAALIGNAGGRPLGYSPLGTAGVVGLDMTADVSGTRGLPFYINGAQSWQERAAADAQAVAAQRASVQDSSLLGRDAQRSHAARDAIHGVAQWDASHGRYEYQLSDKLFQGRQTIVAIVLARPDGSPAPDGVTLDRQTGRIAVQGISGSLELLLIAQTRDGRELLVPVVLDVPADAGRSLTQAQPDGATDAAFAASLADFGGKPAVSQQISVGASLAHQADALLARLTQQG